MSAVDDVATMLALVPWLLERPGATVQETADTFNLPEKQLRQHLYHLDFCGLPGLGGGDLFDVSIVGDRIVVDMADELRRPLRLVPREALTLVLVGEAVAQALDAELPALRSALNKVRVAAGVPDEVAIQLEEDGTRWLTVLRDAIGLARQVAIDYQRRGDTAPSRRTLDPWRLHVSEGYWYVQGHDHDAGDLRTFRLDRVSTVHVLDASRTAEPPSDLPEPRYEAGAGDLEVELLLAPAARWVADAVAADEIEDLDGGGRRLRFHTDRLPWVTSLCLIAGADATVVAPVDLAVEVARLAADSLAAYDG